MDILKQYNITIEQVEEAFAKAVGCNCSFYKLIALGYPKTAVRHAKGCIYGQKNKVDEKGR